MAFTVSLGPDRASNGLARCAGMVESGLWDRQPWEIKRGYCLNCPFRFAYQSTCSADLLTFGEVEQFKQELSTAITWLLETDPGWRFYDRYYREVELAYYYLGLVVPTPRQVVNGFLSEYPYPDDKVAAAFLREWGEIVEGYEGKPFRIEDAQGLQGVAGRIVQSWMEPIRYFKKSAYQLYAASAVLEGTARVLNLRLLAQVCCQLVEACRRAVTAHATLDIS